MYFCVIKSCPNRSSVQIENKNVAFFQIRKEWIDLIRPYMRKSPSKKGLTICSDHFERKFLLKTDSNKMYLTGNPLPTLLLGAPPPLPTEFVGDFSHPPNSSTTSTLTKSMCRICLKLGSASSVRASSVAEKYREVTSFEIQPTDVPQRICLECHNLIQELFEFVRTCKQTEETLQSLQGSCRVKRELVIDLPFEEVKLEATVDDSYDLMEQTVDMKPQIQKNVEPIPESAPEERLRICEICGVFYHKNNYHNHKLSHANVRYFCDLCPGRSYKQKDYLRNHIRENHLAVKRNFCRFCDKTFKNYHQKARHEVRDHGSDSDHVCHECGRRFLLKTVLKKHMETHKGENRERNFHCQFPGCHGMFTSNASLKSHLNTVHGTGKSYVCQDCGKVFKSHKSLMQHQNTHKDRAFACPYKSCQQKFTVAHTLRGHMSKLHPEFPMPPLGTSMRNVDLSIYMPNVQQ